MPDKPPGPVGSRAENPFDVPKGRWKAYAILTVLALAAAIVGVALGIGLLAMAGLIAALFLAIGIVYRRGAVQNKGVRSIKFLDLDKLPGDRFAINDLVGLELQDLFGRDPVRVGFSGLETVNRYYVAHPVGLDEAVAMIAGEASPPDLR